jgi:HSP20 family protein
LSKFHLSGCGILFEKMPFKKKGGFMTTNIIKRNSGSSGIPTRSASGWVDQLLQNTLNNFFNDDFWGLKAGNYTYTIPMNLRETDTTYEMELVAPGLQKEDFKLQVVNGMLNLSYERKEEQTRENRNEGWLHQEYRLQSFSRNFSLDDTVDVNRISAEYSNGILHLTLPKKEGAQRLSKTIQVK